MSVTVYGFYGSFCTQKVYLALAEKGVDARRKTVNIGPPMENYEPWYARLNPRMVIPTLEHDGAIICDSARILRYIDDTFDGPPLLPSAADERAEVERLTLAIDRLPIRELSYGKMSGPLAVFRDRVLMPRRLRLLRKHRAAAPDLAERYDARIADVQAWVATMARPEELRASREELRRVLHELDDRLQRGPFVVGTAYSLADLMATVLSARLLALGVADLTGYPALRDHYQRMKARPRFPSEDIVERMDPRKLAPIIAPFVLPRLAAVLLALAGLLVLLVYLARG